MLAYRQLIKSQGTPSVGVMSTSSVTPRSNELMIAVFTGTGPSAVSGLTGCGLTWTSIRSGIIGATLPKHYSVFWAQGAAPTAGALSGNTGSGSAISYMVYGISGARNTSPIVQSNFTNQITGTSISTTLSTLASVRNEVMAFIGAQADTTGTYTVGSNMTTVDTYTTAPTIFAETSTAPGAPTSVGASGFATGKAFIVAFEIGVAPARSPAGGVASYGTGDHSY